MSYASSRIRVEPTLSPEGASGSRAIAVSAGATGLVATREVPQVAVGAGSRFRQAGAKKSAKIPTSADLLKQLEAVEAQAAALRATAAERAEQERIAEARRVAEEAAATAIRIQEEAVAAARHQIKTGVDLTIVWDNQEYREKAAAQAKAHIANLFSANVKRYPGVLTQTGTLINRLSQAVKKWREEKKFAAGLYQDRLDAVVERLNTAKLGIDADINPAINSIEAKNEFVREQLIGQIEDIRSKSYAAAEKKNAQRAALVAQRVNFVRNAKLKSVNENLRKEIGVIARDAGKALKTTFKIAARNTARRVAQPVTSLIKAASAKLTSWFGQAPGVSGKRVRLAKALAKVTPEHPLVRRVIAANAAPTLAAA